MDLDTARLFLEWRRNQPTLPDRPADRPWVQIVPASFYRHFPQLGADGALIEQVARRLGFPVERLETGSLSTVAAGSRTVAERLRPGAILVSLSKGGADAQVALRQNPTARCWVQIGGLVGGTPLADDLLQAPWPQQALIRTYLRAHGGSWDLVRELRRRPAGPAPVPTVNVVGCPLSFHLSGSTARRHAWLSRLGPNDGTVLLEEARVEGATVPVWGADHYFRLPGMARTLERVLAYAAAQ